MTEPAPRIASLSDAGVRAVLVGTGQYADQAIADVGAVHATLTDLVEVLTTRCGLPTENIQLLENPRSPAEVGTAVATAAESAGDVLLFYFVGHGFIAPDGGLILATANTDRRPGFLSWTAIRYNDLRATLLACRARSIVVLLDCCYSGRAIDTLDGTRIEDLTSNLASVHGGYVLTASARDQLALAPSGERHTTFTGEIIRVLRDGDPESAATITLDELYLSVHRSSLRQGLPEPRRSVSQSAAELRLTDNAATVLHPGKRLIYDSEGDPDAFGRAWNYYNTERKFTRQYFGDLGGIASIRTYQQESVGLNNRLQLIRGLAEFEYMVRSDAPGARRAYSARYRCVMHRVAVSSK